MNARQQYLAEVGKEYNRADEKGRSRLLNEAENRTGLNRKYLICILNHPRAPGPRKLGELRCSDAVAGQLKEISARTIDRVLRREKRVRHLRRNRNPNVQRLIY